MNIILENKLNTIAKSFITEKDDSLRYLGEYLAARRGIDLTEAKELIALIEDEEKCLNEAVDKTLQKTIKILAESLYAIKRTIIKESINPKKDIEKVKQLAKDTGIKVKQTAEKVGAKIKQNHPKVAAEAGKFIGTAAGSTKYHAHKQYAKELLKDTKAWAEKEHGRIGGMSNRKKLAVAAATIGVGNMAHGIYSYAKHRKDKKDKKKD